MKLEEILSEIRKGRRFRRQVFMADAFLTCESKGFGNGMSIEDLLSDDWELEPIPGAKTVTITKSDLYKACLKTSPGMEYEFFETFAKYVGFEE